MSKRTDSTDSSATWTKACFHHEISAITTRKDPPLFQTAAPRYPSQCGDLRRVDKLSRKLWRRSWYYAKGLSSALLVCEIKVAVKGHSSFSNVLRMNDL